MPAAKAAGERSVRVNREMTERLRRSRISRLRRFVRFLHTIFIPYSHLRLRLRGETTTVRQTAYAFLDVIT
jgi:hypothetical protein